VKQDLVEAYKWYALAMAQNEADPKSRAQVNSNALAPRLTSGEIKEAEKRAASFVPEVQPEWKDAMGFGHLE
jgi:TPR repeat protein